MTETTLPLSTKQAQFVAACERHGWVVESIEANRYSEGVTIFARNGAGTRWALLGAYKGERSTRHGAMVRSYTGDYESVTLRSLFLTVSL